MGTNSNPWQRSQEPNLEANLHMFKVLIEHTRIEESGLHKIPRKASNMTFAWLKW